MLTRRTPFLGRMVRAAQLDKDIYEEVERDRDATGQAALVVLISGAAAAIAALLSGNVGGLFSNFIGVFIGWIVWSYITYFVGTSIFATPNTRVTPGEVLRTIGFAHVPGILFVFGFIPFLGGVIAVAAAVWMLVAGVVAVRQAMDFDTGRAVGTVAVGAAVYIAIIVVLAIIAGILSGIFSAIF